MDVFTLLVFEGTDSVAEVRTLRAENTSQARRTVDVIMRTKPAAAGHQLWRNGVCVSRTYPSASGVSPDYVDHDLYESHRTEASEQAAAYLLTLEPAQSTAD